ncbi:MAG: 50S ribosomal protein L23 [Pseudobdellovibrionaceae bacterium]|jgi:large subunit ribosomal protein L23
MKQVIRKPLITEKNTLHNAAGVYVFEVDLDSTKTEIRNAVQKNFKVKVEAVRTSLGRGRGKMTKFGMGKAPYFKKAFVKLAAGEKIALFEGV